MKTLVLRIEGMHCDGCATIIQALLEQNDGVWKAAASYKESATRVLYDPRTVTEDQLIATIEKGGYRVAGRSHG